jgi:ABC-type branched-subunit amino acid transport system ATPase component
MPEGAMGESPALLLIRALDAGYGRVQVLFGLDLAVAPGEVVAVLGANGAGKTTMLRAISGLLTPSGGLIELDGTDLSGIGAADRARGGIVQVRGADVFPGLTVDDNLRAALAAHRKQDAASLSGGEQQMVALGCALLYEPRLLLVDELSLGLAPLVVQRLLEVLRALRDDGQAMVIVEQSLAVAASLTERVVYVEKGRIRFDGSPADLTADDELARAIFLGGPS